MNGIVGCCARAESGHAVAPVPISVMKSRRLIAPSRLGTLKLAYWKRAMSVMGQKQTSGHVRVMSALPPKADMDQHGCDVRFVPKADICRCSNRRQPLSQVVANFRQ